MKLWLAATLLSLLAGCASESTSKYGKGVDLLRMAMHRNHVEAPTAAQVASKPYYQLQAISPDGQAIMILGGVEGDVQGWYGHDGDAVFLDRGQVVRTIGLRANIDAARWASNNPFEAGLQTLQSELTTSRVVDWSPGYRYGVVEEVRLVPVRMESVDILGTSHQLRRVDEFVRAVDAHFEAKNTYWVDPADGFVWRSHQVIAPGMPLDLIQLRPYKESHP